MSERDDWRRFEAMMAAGGWYRVKRSIFGWRNGVFYVASTGLFISATGSESNVGTWREWLAAGTSPVPW